MREWTEEGGFKEDDPITKALLGIASQGDRMEGILKTFGPGAAKEAAEAARKETAIGMRALTRQVGWLGKGLLAVAGAGLFCVGLFAGKHWPVNTELGPLPRDLASVVRLQDWPAQWAACQSKPIKHNDAEWCYMPMVMKIKQPS
jgi:hypothetical protein